MQVQTQVRPFRTNFSVNLVTKEKKEKDKNSPNPSSSSDTDQTDTDSDSDEGKVFSFAMKKVLIACFMLVVCRNDCKIHNPLAN